MNYRKLSIIIPCYNEDKTILEVLRRVERVDLGEINKEIIIVDDGSHQATKDVLKTVEGEYKVIYLPQNMGKGYAVRQGLKEASGDIVLIQDADLEYNPEDYSKLLRPILNDEISVVYGSRFLNKNNKRSSNINAWGVKFLSFLTNVLYKASLTDIETCYKVFAKEVLDKIKLRANKFDFEPEITAKILKNRNKIKEVPIQYSPRTVEEGKKIRVRDGLLAIWVLIKNKFKDE